MEFLQAVAQHWAVDFFQDVEADFHRVVRGDAQDLAVECGVVQLAQGQSVLHDRIAPGIGVFNDVGGVQQLLMSEPAKRAAVSIGSQDALPESLLVKPAPYVRSQIGTAGFAGAVGYGHLLPVKVRSQKQGSVIHRNGEGQILRIISHDEHGPDSQILAGNDSVKINQGNLVAHRFSQPPVVSMGGIAAPVAVSQQVVFAEGIIVRPFRSGGDGERNFRQDARFENPLGADQGNALPFELKSSGQQFPG